MKYLSVKGLDKKVSQIVLGTAWFGLDRNAEHDGIFGLMDLYVELGGNAIDTGRFYGAGRSEGVVARWLEKSGMHDRLVLIDKACHHYVDEDNVHHTKENRVRPELITEDLNYSLENMKVAYFDIYLLHRDNPEEPVEGLIDRLERHRQEGKIKTYGVSNWSLERLEQAQNYAIRKGYQGISVNNPSYSLAKVQKPRWHGCVYADDAYALWHADKDISLFSWAPQAAGFFADIYKRDGSTPQDVADAYFSDENFEKLTRVKMLARERADGTEPINVALAYVLSQSFPVAAVVGPRSTDELKSNVHSLDVHLSPREIEWLALRSDAK